MVAGTLGRCEGAQERRRGEGLILHSEKCRHLRSQSVRTLKKRNQRSRRKTPKREPLSAKLGGESCLPEGERGPP